MPETVVRIDCRGRDADGMKVLEEPLEVHVLLNRSPGSDLIAVGPTDCPHNAGGHGQRCTASHPNQPKEGDGVACRFSFDLPHAEQTEGWQPPEELLEAIETMWPV